MKLNAHFLTNIHEIYGTAGEAWLKDLPRLIKELAELWDFRFIEPMDNLSYGFVGLVEIKATGKKAVLKTMPPTESLARQIRWLNCMEKGAPQVYAADETYNAYLMEYLTPGMPLKALVQAGEDDAATKIICHTIRELQTRQHADRDFPHLSELPHVLELLKGKYEARLLSQAQSLFQELTSERTHDVVLHGDLHHDNILSCGSGWKAIDPHGYLGDPVAEVGAMIRNPFDTFPTDRPLAETLERRLRIMADELPFDIQRIKAWAFCMTVLSTAWTLEGHGRVPESDITFAIALDQAKI